MVVVDCKKDGGIMCLIKKLSYQKQRIFFYKYSDYLTLYYYNNGYAHIFENPNEEYDVFLGLDRIFQIYIIKEKAERKLYYLKN